MSEELRETFARDGFVDVTSAIDPTLRARVAAEASAVLDAHGERRDIRIPATGMSPRCYRVASRDAIVAQCRAAAAAYRGEDLLALLAGLTGEAVVPVPHVPEEIIATRLERAGDTHGWHWDDYAFALVWIAQAPSPSAGAALERIPEVPWCKDAPGLNAILAARTTERANPPSRSVYLLRADTTLHRVAPLVFNERRDALCFSYAAASDVARAVTHETLDAILLGLS